MRRDRLVSDLFDFTVVCCGGDGFALHMRGLVAWYPLGEFDGRASGQLVEPVVFVVQAASAPTRALAVRPTRGMCREASAETPRFGVRRRLGNLRAPMDASFCGGVAEDQTFMMCNFQCDWPQRLPSSSVLRKTRTRARTRSVEPEEMCNVMCF